MDWIDEIKLLDNNTNNSNKKKSDLQIPIFKLSNEESVKFDEYLNKISKFTYLVGICKILQSYTNINTTIKNELDTSIFTDWNSVSIDKNLDGEDLYLLTTENSIIPNNNSNNNLKLNQGDEIWYWNNLSKLPTFNFKQIGSNLQPFTLITENDNISTSILNHQTIQTSYGMIRNWEILDKNKFKIYHLTNTTQETIKPTRIWYSIPEEFTFKFYKVLQDKLTANLKSQDNNNIAFCQNFLNHQHVMITPTWLTQQGIKYETIIQHQDELIILFPSSCTFAIDLTQGNVISELKFEFKVNYNRSGINQNCLCNCNDNNNTNEIPQNIDSSLSNEFNHSISGFSSPLCSRLLNTGNTTTTTLSSSCNVNEKEMTNNTNNIENFLLPSIESIVNINEKINDESMNLNMDNNKLLKNNNNNNNQMKMEVLPSSNNLSSVLLSDELPQKPNPKHVASSNSILNFNLSTPLNNSTTSSPHLPLPQLINSPMENYKLTTGNPMNLSNSNNGNILTNVTNACMNQISNPQPICLANSNGGPDTMKRITSPTFLPLNLSRGITESPLSLTMTVPVSNDSGGGCGLGSIGRYSLNGWGNNIQKQSKLMNNTLLNDNTAINNNNNNNGNNGTTTCSILDSSTFYNTGSLQTRNTKKSTNNRVTKRKRYTTSDYNDLIYNKFQEQRQLNRKNNTDIEKLIKNEDENFNISSSQNDSLPQTSFFSQSQSKFLPTEVIITDAGKIYVCSDCKRKFSSGHHLTRHKKSVHSGEKPHACPKCGKKFKRRDHVLQHLNKKIPCR